MFVVVDGVDGYGKSTTISRITHLANRHHIANTYAKETIKTSLGHSIRRAVLDLQNQLTKSEQATAFAMARLECLKKLLFPLCLGMNCLLGTLYVKQFSLSI